MPHSLHHPGKSHALSLIHEGKTSSASWEAPKDDERQQSFCLGDSLSYPFGKGGTLYWDALRSIVSVANGQGDRGISEAASRLLDMKKAKVAASANGGPRLARCPNCSSFDVTRSPGGTDHGPMDRCGRCSASWPHKPGSVTAESVYGVGASPFSLSLAETGEGTPLPLALEGLPAKDTEGNPIHYRRVLVARCRPGWVHRGSGTPLDLSPQRADEWVKNVAALSAAGVRPYVTPKHPFDEQGNFVTPDARDTLGYVVRLERDGEDLYAVVALHGDEALAVAAKNSRSIGVAKSDAMDAEGRAYCGETLHHLALVPNPALPDLGGTARIAASADIPEFTFNPQQQTPQAVAPRHRSYRMSPQLAKQVREKLGIGADVPDDQLDDKAAEKALALSADVSVANGTIATLTTERDAAKSAADAAKAEAKSKADEVLALSADKPRTSPEDVADYLESVAERREQAIASGAVTAAQAAVLDTLISDGKGNPTTIALSAHGEGAERRRFGIKFWKLVAKLAEGKDGAVKVGNAVNRPVVKLDANGQPVSEPVVTEARRAELLGLVGYGTANK